MADPPKTRSQADALVARNQEQSPLLRLPGELRNKIYQLLFGDLVLDIIKVDGETETEPEHLEFQLAVRKAESTRPNPVDFTLSRAAFKNCFENLHEWVNITLASRQLFADTHLFLFKVNSLRLCAPLNYLPSDMYGLLTRSQLDAITSVRLCNSPIYREGVIIQVLPKQSVSLRITPEGHLERPRDSVVPDPPQNPFKLNQLPSLKKLIVEEYCSIGDKVELEKAMREKAGNQDLKIMYE
ncbi:hypothetical protein FB567DRAFT_602342 [Paraphoma chrysanthemicola]|uniref:Uncharacterized protein n=1 Tax=Paraphoma chrysanthemicola TaxID=798071 RepID=A0A8K0R5M7_9PLEO|nr:hypothetical protein FB567DRAFT_602342 [Paraphoma chrysanthemicola]